MTASKDTKLSRRERQIMDIVHEKHPCSAQEIQQLLPEPPGYSAVRALIARLVKRQILGIQRSGLKYLYFPIEDTQSVQLSATQRLLKTFFKGSKSQAVNALLNADGDELSSREIEDIERTIAHLKNIKENKE